MFLSIITGDGVMNYPSIDAGRTGAKLRRLCILRGVTVRQIQEYLGLSCPQSVYRWLKGASLPTVDNLYALSELFQVGVDELLAGNRVFEGKRMSELGRFLSYRADIFRITSHQEAGEKKAG